MTFQLDPTATLPTDGTNGTLVGRVWRHDVEGPSIIALRADECYDVSRAFPTVRDVCEAHNPAAAIASAKRERIGDIKSILANTPEHSRDPAKPFLLAPIDLQAVKAAGVTFAASLLERVIEEQARGEPQRAAAVRVEVEATIAGAVGSLKPGSPERPR
jgi:fumarylacetoacetate (FAA) hydrolase family protein